MNLIGAGLIGFAVGGLFTYFVLVIPLANKLTDANDRLLFYLKGKK